MIKYSKKEQFKIFYRDARIYYSNNMINKKESSLQSYARKNAIQNFHISLCPDYVLRCYKQRNLSSQLQSVKLANKLFFNRLFQF